MNFKLKEKLAQHTDGDTNLNQVVVYNFVKMVNIVHNPDQYRSIKLIYKIKI